MGFSSAMIYHPSEDSYLIAEQVKRYAKGKTFIDIGSGSGILAKTALQVKAKSVLASDINFEAVKKLKEQKIPAVHSDLFLKIKKRFDIIVFNPPYLPEDFREDKESKLVTTGGKRGDEIILRFLKQAKHHLSPSGFILLLLSSLTPKDRIEKLLSQLKLDKQKIASQKLFQEVLEVWKITKNPNV